eukprot:6543255-Pyramimonas_sp.AAC.1
MPRTPVFLCALCTFTAFCRLRCLFGGGACLAFACLAPRLAGWSGSSTVLFFQLAKEHQTAACASTWRRAKYALRDAWPLHFVFA